MKIDVPEWTPCVPGQWWENDWDWEGEQGGRPQSLRWQLGGVSYADLRGVEVRFRDGRVVLFGDANVYGGTCGCCGLEDGEVKAWRRWTLS
jgi:hypothetical protein